MNQLQTKLFDILKWFHNFCEQNKLRYFVIGGTFLGAVRHKGFIPWDDDIDVGMPRKDYERLKEIFYGCENQKIDKYILETIDSDAPDFFYTFGKLYDTETTLIEKTRTNCKRGIYLDIFPIDGIGNTLEESFENFKKLDRKNMFLMTRICAYEKRRALYKNFAIFLSRLIPSILVNEKKIARDFDKDCQKISYGNAYYVCNCSSTYRAKEIMEKRLISNLKEYEFEGFNVWGPELYDEYLTHIFGNWRQLPPVEKRTSAHNFILMDLNKSYLF